ncbi:phospholipid/cholesterol/gamma-HCH transport system substrate-binding protein [Catalinimonas alkaloidigena]|uniref:MlaD family protein n=1 Tax=Catalinimonas alkaloidigena TaxID=1075417 RepID=UPI0024075A43|nr:MlaD family protein [Catalinimonas alkaloidigena]MDF9795814.1 phospholipid/cholesterol/gamma-HCH transport system substrate-binding protein [Catalinimonas alkaloidigena]
MDDSKKKNIKLGLFVILGLLLFVAAIFFIGARQNLFGSNIEVTATFKNVEGLQVGSQVRFSGINIGTVESVTLKNDSAVQTTLLLEQRASQFIKEDAVAAISTAGLMGNKIITISSGSQTAASISDGDQLETTSPASVEDIMANLKETSNSAMQIASNIERISTRIEEGKGVIGNLVADTTNAEQVESMINSFEMATGNVQSILQDIDALAERTRNGEGALGKLMADQETAEKVEMIIDSLAKTGSISTDVAQNILEFSEKLSSDRGALDKVLTDTAFANDINETVNSVKQTSESIDQTTERINDSWILNIFGGGKDRDKIEEENKSDTSSVEE